MKTRNAIKLISHAAIAFGIAMPLAAQAQSTTAGLKMERGTGLFVGLSAGAAELDAGPIGLVEVGDPEGAGAAKLRIGYWLSEHWGVEGNFMNHGTVSQKYANGTFKATGQSYGVALLGRLPINHRWDFVGKLNLLHTRLKDDGSTGNLDAYKKLTGSSANLVFPGLEIGYRFNRNMRLYFEAEYRGGAGDEAGVGYAGLGLAWKF